MRSGSSRASPPRTRSSSSASSQRAPAQHAVHELARPAAVARDRAARCAARTRCRAARRRADRRSSRPQRRARPSRRHAPPSRGARRSLTGRASPSWATTAPPPRAAACGRRDTPAGPHRRRDASRSPCAPDRAAAAMPVFIRMPSTPCSIMIARVRRRADAGVDDHRHGQAMLDRADGERVEHARAPSRSATRAA